MDFPSKLDQGNDFIRRFRELILEAEEAGFSVDVDVTRDPYDSTEIVSLDIDLNFGNGYIDTIKTLDW